MSNANSRPDLSGILEQRRRELSDRPDISARMRKLSESNTRNKAPERPRKRPTLLTMALAIVAVVLLLGCGITTAVAVASGVWFHNQLNDPSQTALDFYGALHQQDYTRAYSFFSGDARSRLSKTDFTTQFSAYDSVGGIVQSYTVDGGSKVQGSSAVVTVDVVRRGNPNQAQVQTIYLVSENGGWKIDRIQLGNSIPAPTS